MAWIWDVLKTISGNTAANQKLIIDGFKELMQEHRSEAKAAKERAEVLLAEVQAMRENEEECRRQLFKLREEFRDVKEELIFTKILTRKHPDNERPDT